MPDPLLITILVAAAAASGLSKSGLLVSVSTASVPLLTIVMSARDAAGVMLPVLIALDLAALLVYRRQVDRRILAIMLPGGLLGILIGWAVSAVISEPAVRLAIGIITGLFVLDAVLPLRKKLEGLPPSRGWGRFWGAVSGLTSFISHTGGPPYQIYVLPQRLPPLLFSGTSAVFFAAINAAKLVPFFFLGQLSISNLHSSMLLIPVAYLAMAIGAVLVRRISPKIFYGVTYFLLAVLAVNLIWQGTAALL